MIGRLPGYTRSRALGTSHDGEIVVGRSTALSGDAVGQAFRWTSTTGLVGLGYIRPGQFYSEAAAVSRDGTTIIGHARGASGFNEAFVWRQGSGMLPLPGLDTLTNDGQAFGVNNTGSIIVGRGSVNGQQRGIMWLNGQAVPLGLAPGWVRSAGNVVNDSGTVIGGDVSGGPGTRHAAIWTPERGMERLVDYLAFHGVSVPSNIQMQTITGISADGMTMCGYTGVPGSGIQGFIVTIPAPGSAVMTIVGLLACGRRRRLAPTA